MFGEEERDAETERRWGKRKRSRNSIRAGGNWHTIRSSEEREGARAPPSPSASRADACSSHLTHAQPASAQLLINRRTPASHGSNDFWPKHSHMSRRKSRKPTHGYTCTPSPLPTYCEVPTTKLQKHAQAVGSLFGAISVRQPRTKYLPDTTQKPFSSMRRHQGSLTRFTRGEAAKPW